MAAGIVYQLLASSSAFNISNKYAVDNHRLKTKAELKG